MTLNQEEKTAIKNLQAQEQNCIDKYSRYAGEAKDPELKDLFNELKAKEEQHHASLGKLLNGEVPCCNCNDSAGKEYSPKGTYKEGGDSKDKQSDCYLATDGISTEKLISGEYNTDVFNLTDSDARKLLADIQVEEQNHAEMLYKYKKVNGMA